MEAEGGSTFSNRFSLFFGVSKTASRNQVFDHRGHLADSGRHRIDDRRKFDYFKNFEARCLSRDYCSFSWYDTTVQFSTILTLLKNLRGSELAVHTSLYYFARYILYWVPSYKIDDISCTNLGVHPPLPNHDRFRSSGGRNDTSVVAMISRSMFCRVRYLVNLSQP